MTAAEFRKLGVTGEVRQAKVRTTGRVAKGAPYHTICKVCGEIFHTQASEDRHLEETKHGNYRLVLGYTS